MKARAVLLGIALVFVCGSHALAQDDEEALADATLVGWYVGASAGGGPSNFSRGISAKNGFGGDITFGYRASEYVSFEIETEFLENFIAEPKTAAQTKSEVDIWTSTVNFRVHFPIEDWSFEPYLTYGAGVMDVETKGGVAQTLGTRNNTDIMVKGGVGMAYQLTDEMAFYANGTYALPLGNIKEFDHAVFTVGFLYKFIEEY